MPLTEVSAGAAPALRELDRTDRNAVMRAMRWYYHARAEDIAETFGISARQVRSVTGMSDDPVNAAWTSRMLDISVPERQQQDEEERRPWSYPSPQLHALAQEARAEIEMAIRRGFNPDLYRR